MALRQLIPWSGCEACPGWCGDEKPHSLLRPTAARSAARMQGRSPGDLGLRELVSPGLAAIIERCVDTRLARC
jgi:hypothetical protein